MHLINESEVGECRVSAQGTFRSGCQFKADEGCHFPRDLCNRKGGGGGGVVLGLDWHDK